MKTYAYGIPTINQGEKLAFYLALYTIDYKNAPVTIHVIDNGNQKNFELFDDCDNSNIHLYRLPVNLGVAASWNMLCAIIFQKHDYAVILNDDLYFGKQPTELEKVFESDHGFYVGDRGFSAFAISKKVFEKVGQFDIDFYPAYFEDNDYLRRMEEHGIEPFHSKVMNPAVWRQSQSVIKQPELNINFEKNREIYNKKWPKNECKKSYDSL